MISINRLSGESKKILGKKNVSNKVVVLCLTMLFVTGAFMPIASSVMVFNPSPSDSAVDVSKDLSELLFNITASSGNLMNYSVMTNPNIGSDNGTNKINGSYSVNVSNLDYNTTYYWNVNCTNGTHWANNTYWFTTETNDPPIVSNESPVDNSDDVSISLSNISFNLSDPDGDLMDYTVETLPSIGTGANSNVANGSVFIGVSDLLYNTTYHWYVNVSDPFGSGKWNNKTFSFSTEAEPVEPIVTDVYPTNEDANYNPRFSVDIHDYQNDVLTVIFRTNATGIWQTLGIYSGGNTVYIQDTSNMNVKNHMYYWSVNVTDGSYWTNETYSFTAQPFALKWTYNTGASTKIGPLAVDVDSDGIYEIFVTGGGIVSCVNGSTGELIWNFTYSGIGGHSPFEIHDLNNDGIEELVVAAADRTIALHANNGSVYWNVLVRSSNKHLLIADIEGDGYPYVYIASDDINNGWNGTGRLRKLRGTDGAVLVEVFAWRPCWSGVSIADVNNDGNFELFLTDRSTWYPDEGSLGRGILCYDADTLELLWYDEDILCSSHCVAIVDVNDDDILDAVVINQAGQNGGIFVMDGYTGGRIPGKWSYHLGLPGHSQFSIYDIDGDGNLELITARDYYHAKVWDLGTWSLDAELTESFGEPPKMADVIGDEKLEIIGVNYYDGVSAVYIYNNNYELIETIPTSAIASTLVQDIDNDGQNELILVMGGLKVYDTSAYAPTPRVRTNSLYYSERNMGAGVYVPPPGAPQPILKEEYPANGSVNLSLNPALSVHAIDFHYDLMNITISTNASGVWEDVTTFTDVGNDFYTYIPTNMNITNTTYYWRVTATDPYADNLTTIETYSFTTAADEPVVSDPHPADDATDVSVNLTQLSFNLTDYQNDLMNYNITTSPNIGSDTGTSVSNGIYYVNVNGLVHGRIYTWYVNVTDGTYWTNETFGFQTEQMMVFDPFGEGWQYKKMITVNHTKVAVNLTNFPILIDITDADLKNHAQIDGDDILFMNADGTARRSYHEIEYYNSTNGHLIVWVNVTSLSSEEDTILYMYYGNNGVANQENPKEVWNSHYKMVQHLDETAGIAYDSTVNNNDGTPNGVTMDASGKIDGADEFDGINDYIDLPKDKMTAGLSEVTLELWINADEWVPTNTIWDEVYSGTRWQFSIQCENWYTRDSSTGTAGTMDNSLSLPAILPGEWHHMVFVYSVSQSLKAIYLDGELNTSTNISIDVLTDDRELARIGFAADGDNFDGTIDEVRLLDAAITPGRITTEYVNQQDPSSFYSVGLQKSIAPIISQEIPENGSTGIELNPTLSVNVSHNLSRLMDILFETNASGSWQKIQVYKEVGNGTYTATTSNMSEYHTTYNWRVTVKDENEATIKNYSFTTLIDDLLVDSEFNDSVNSTDLRTDNASQDWYESMGDVPTLLTLNISDVGGNFGKKAALRNFGISNNAYLTQEFSTILTDSLNVSFDIFIDSIEDSGSYDRTAHIYIGDDSNASNCPTGTSDECFVMMAFYDSTPSSSGNDLEIRAREPGDSYSDTSSWATVAANLSYNSWYILRVELDIASGTYDIYVDDVLVCSNISSYGSAAIEYISFVADDDGRGDFYVDNVFAPAERRYKLDVNTIGNGTVNITPGESSYVNGTVVTLNATADSGWIFDSWSGDINGSNDFEIVIMDEDKTTIATFAENITPSSENFTIIILPDTQVYSWYYPYIFTNQTGWIVDHQDELNIVYVGHLGDIVQHAEEVYEWENANYSMSLLEDPINTLLPDGIPYSVIPGNCDIPTVLYNQYFNVSRFSGRNYYGGYYSDNNENNYVLFSAGDMDFIVISIGYGPDTNRLNWADNLLKTYSNRRAIIISHYILNGDGSWGSQGQEIYNALKDNPNLFLMLCGHVPGENMREDVYEGNTVYSLLADYQGRSNGGNGWLRFMEFCPETNEIKVKTYSPYLDQFEQDADSEFTLMYDMGSGGPTEYVLTINTIGNGTVNVTPSGPYQYGENVTLNATANAGWVFSNWSGDIDSAENPINVTVISNMTVNATFTEIEYTLTINIIGNGSVNVTPSGHYHYGDIVTLNATADLGWTFINWSGDIGSTDNPVNIALNADKSVTATFVEDCYTLDVIIVGNGSVYKDPDLTCYVYGTVVELTAMDDLGWTFTNWSGDIDSIDNPINITMTSDMVVNATFTEDGYTIAINVIGSGEVNTTPSGPYQYGENVTLNATANAGWVFSNWSGDISSTENPINVTVISNMMVNATFIEIEYTLTINVIGNGSVNATPSGHYHYGDIVTLNATADLGWSFINWSGDIGSTDNPVNITIDSDKIVNATFTQDEYTLAINVIGSGEVNTTPSGSYHYGDIVTLNATADLGWTFINWSGDIISTDNPVIITMTSDMVVNATFTEDGYTITVNIIGSGEVNTTPSGPYQYGDNVTLNATANAGWVFSNWSGDITSTENPINVTVISNMMVNATFIEIEYTLTINSIGNGSVNVTPSGPYHCGDIVTLNATADLGWTFINWSGDIGSTDNPVNIALNADKSVTATFVEDCYTLDVTIVGNGSVSKDPDLTCYVYGAVVELTAMDDLGWTFSGWSGDISSTDNPIIVTMTSDMVVNATFTEDGYTITVNIIGSGEVNTTPSGPYQYGDNVTLNATANAGWVFSNWSGDIDSTENPINVTVISNMTVNATFTEIEYTLTINSIGNGSVNVTPSGPYHYGDIVTLNATADLGWTFINWSGDISSTDNPVNITMDSDKVVNATFTQDDYTLTVNVIGNGSVNVTPSGPYHCGDIVTLNATADLGWTFINWSGDIISTDNPVIITMTSDMVVNATFTEDGYTITVNIIGSGEVNTTPSGPYHYGDNVTLNATANAGWVFSNWSGDITSTENPINVTVISNMMVNATFIEIEYTLTINSIGNGSVNVTPSGHYHYGDIVTLNATADLGWSFINWSGNISSMENLVNITMDADKSVTATFVEGCYTLDVTIVGNGSVSKDPDLTCYVYGTVVELTAMDDLGWTFSGWSGDISSTDNPIIVTITSDMVVNATFTEDGYTIAINVIGSGEVNTTPSGPYQYGENVTLNATADLGWTFTNWSGNITSTENPINVTVISNMMVNATFIEIEYTLTINSIGNGSVNVTPSGHYHYGDIVTLNATADLGWTFINWSGDVSSIDNPINFTMTSNMVINATFTQDEYTLTVNVIGNGTVDATPSGHYHYGDNVTLNATANAGWVFSNWSGDQAGNTNPEYITMDSNKSVTATFVDSMPPEISNVSATPLETLENEYVNITCNVTDNVEVDIVKVNITGPAGFTSVNVTMMGDNTYYYNTTYDISGVYNYFIWANDTSGNTDMSFVGQFNITEVAKQEYAITVHTNWSKISLPFNKSVDKTDFVVYYDATNYSWNDAVSQGIILDDVYDWNRISQTYELTDTLMPGFGYNVYAYYDCELRIEIEKDIESDEYITDLMVEWNTIGLPHNESILKENIIVEYEGVDYNWTQATTDDNLAGEPIILGFIYDWNRSSQIYELTDTLVPGYGYLMYSYYNCTLKRQA